MKQLAVVTHYFPTRRGGVEKVASALASGLAADYGWSVSWMASDTDPIPVGLPDGMQLIPASSWDGINRVFGIPWPVWSPGALFGLWRLIGKADVLHVHDALYFGNVFAWFFSRLRGVPIVVTQHIGSVPYRSVIVRAIHALANRILGRVVLSSAEQVVVISPAVLAEFEKFCCFRSLPVYWPNGVDTEVFTPIGEIARNAEILSARQVGKRVFMFAGRFVEKKGIDILRQLAMLHSEALWILAGDGPIDPVHWDLPNVIVVRGETGARLARYYRAADLLVLPSVGEGFPLVVQEAMACGTPAMVGKDTANGCPSAKALLIVEEIGGDTAMRWARRLAEMQKNPHRLQALKSEVAKFSHDNWSWKSTIVRYAGLLDTMAHGKSAS